MRFKQNTKKNKNSSDRREFCDTLRNWIREADLSESEFSILSGIPKATLSRILDYRSPYEIKKENIVRCCCALKKWRKGYNILKRLLRKDVILERALDEKMSVVDLEIELEEAGF